MQYSLRTPGLEELPRAQYASHLHTARVLLERGADITGVVWSLPIDQLARILIAITGGLTIAWVADRDNAGAGQPMDFAADTIGALSVSASRSSSKVWTMTLPIGSVR